MQYKKKSVNWKCSWWEARIFFVSFTGIISRAVKRMMVTRTGNTLWASQRARKEVSLFPDTVLDPLHAVAAEQALIVMDTATLKGAWHKPCTSLPFGSLFVNTVCSPYYWILTTILTGVQCMCEKDWTYLPVWKRGCGDRSGSGHWAVLIGDSASPSCSASLWHAFKRAVPTKRPIQSNFHCFSFEIPGELDSWILSNESQETSCVICSSVSSRSIKCLYNTDVSSFILGCCFSVLFFYLTQHSADDSGEAGES